MNREEIIELIQRLNKDLEYLDALAFKPGVSVEMELRAAIDGLNKILQNGVTKTKKYTIEVIKEQGDGFLTLVPKGFMLGDKDNEGWNVQSYFTQKEINEMKENSNLAIDWNKVIIKPVEDNDDEKEV